MDSQHQQYPTDSVQQPVPKILPAAEFFSIVRKKLLAGRTVCFRVTGNSMFPLFRAGRDSVTKTVPGGRDIAALPRGKGFRLHTPLLLRDD